MRRYLSQDEKHNKDDDNGTQADIHFILSE
jgi:hypothetical protein